MAWQRGTIGCTQFTLAGHVPVFEPLVPLWLLASVVGFARRFRVLERSMAPLLLPGDRLVVIRAPRKWRTGDVIVARNPEANGAFVVKRIAAISGDFYQLRGDNVDMSRDSRHFGAVHADEIVGRAVYRYFPEARRGSIPRGQP